MFTTNIPHNFHPPISYRKGKKGAKIIHTASKQASINNEKLLENLLRHSTVRCQPFQVFFLAKYKLKQSVPRIITIFYTRPLTQKAMHAFLFLCLTDD